MLARIMTSGKFVNPVSITFDNKNLERHTKKEAGKMRRKETACIKRSRKDSE